MCSECSYRFTTYEKLEDVQLQIKKRGGSYETFSREKIERALQIACVKRPVSTGDIEEIVDDIVKKLHDKMERVVDSSKIGDMVMQALRKLDHVSYVRFASIYKDFKDPEEFRLEIERLKQ
jgi:transcriptional repressor NrdR